MGLGHLSAAEATVLLSTEPLWAAVFAAGLLGESLSAQAGLGGCLLVAACLMNAASPEWLREKLGVAGSSRETPLTEELRATTGSSFP
jgi:drug/metabolite transporter (DMT)-like permease